MINQKVSELSHVQIEVIDTLIGFEDKQKIQHKQLAGKRLLAARRAIEAHREQQHLARQVGEEDWFADLDD